MPLGWAQVLALVLIQVTADGESEMQDSDGKKHGCSTENPPGCSTENPPGSSAEKKPDGSVEKKEGKRKVEIKKDKMSKYDNTHHQPSVSTQEPAHPSPRPRMLIMFHRTLKQYAVTVDAIHHLLIVRPWAFCFVKRPYTLSLLPVKNYSLAMHTAAIVLLPHTIPQLPMFQFETFANQARGEEAESSDDRDASGGTVTYTPRLISPIARALITDGTPSPIRPTPSLPRNATTVPKIIHRIVQKLEIIAGDEDKEDFEQLPVPDDDPTVCHACQAEPFETLRQGLGLGRSCKNRYYYQARKRSDERCHAPGCPIADFGFINMPTDPTDPVRRRACLREMAATGCGYWVFRVVQALQIRSEE